MQLYLLVAVPLLLSLLAPGICGKEEAPDFFTTTTTTTTKTQDHPVPTQQDFDGSEHYTSETLDICQLHGQDETWTYSDAICFFNGPFWSQTQIEMISWVPGLFIYRGLLDERQVADYVKLLEDLEFEATTTLTEDGGTVQSNYRVATSIDTNGCDYPEAASIEATVRRSIPAINFDSTEALVALKYGPGGHNAAHDDYIEQPYELQDEFYRHFGDRLATLLMVFKTADIGGATFFPYHKIAVRPNPGDALFWFNMRSDQSKEELAFHGGCPIFKGEKIVSTIWVRANFQKVFDFPHFGSLDAGCMFDDLK